MHDLGQGRAADTGQAFIENGEQLSEKLQFARPRINEPGVPGNLGKPCLKSLPSTHERIEGRDPNRHI